MAVFCIDTATGQVATFRQLVEAGLVSPDENVPPRPWLRVQGPGDASTMWYAIMRRRVRGVFIGTVALRHGGYHASLLEQGWEDVPISEIGTREPA